ncbi:hypothetical protein ACFXHA_41220 [Nocardia sp. NPDC059240]|uniref:hypothetical protein n=1 Tax=Nocardia sp. NPDC059240 TaxID=3346786 RepID=UPI0036C50AB5
MPSALNIEVRAFYGLVGLAFLGYGIYLAAFFHTGEYRIFFWVFILPVTMFLNAMRAADTSDPTDQPARRRTTTPRPRRAPTPHRSPATRDRIAARKAAQLDAIRAKHTNSTDAQ